MVVYDQSKVWNPQAEVLEKQINSASYSKEGILPLMSYSLGAAGKSSTSDSSIDCFGITFFSDVCILYGKDG